MRNALKRVLNGVGKVIHREDAPFGALTVMLDISYAVKHRVTHIRLHPGYEVRLKGAYIVRCTGCVKDADGNVTEILCEYDPETRGGNTPDGRKVRGTIHWVDAHNCADAEVRLYDNLFADADPEGDGKDYLECLNPDSLSVLTGCKVERMLAGAEAPAAFQFLRLGYFAVDNKDSAPGHPVFNRAVALKDSFKKG